MMGAGMAAGSASQYRLGPPRRKAQGAEGVGGMVRGTASNLWNATRESMHNKASAKALSLPRCGNALRRRGSIKITEPIKFLKNYITNIKKNKGENAHVSD